MQTHRVGHACRCSVCCYCTLHFHLLSFLYLLLFYSSFSPSYSLFQLFVSSFSSSSSIYPNSYYFYHYYICLVHLFLLFSPYSSTHRPITAVSYKLLFKYCFILILSSSGRQDTLCPNRIRSKDSDIFKNCLHSLEYYFSIPFITSQPPPLPGPFLVLRVHSVPPPTNSPGI